MIYFIGIFHIVQGDSTAGAFVGQPHEEGCFGIRFVVALPTPSASASVGFGPSSFLFGCLRLFFPYPLHINLYIFEHSIGAMKHVKSKCLLLTLTLGPPTRDVPMKIRGMILKTLLTRWTLMNRRHTTKLQQTSGTVKGFNPHHHKIKKIIGIAFYRTLRPWVFTPGTTHTCPLTPVIRSGNRRCFLLSLLQRIHLLHQFRLGYPFVRIHQRLKYFGRIGTTPIFVRVENEG
mmetsp:Transcript_15770/g.23621  ORF Transcript_15770/g.23621 Transcript_15770/m.23621 type:complete len:232 (-) Transcript_15770:546-1241(-)